MVARKKIARINIDENTELRHKVIARASDTEQAAMLKDFHLLEMAMSTDEIVISLDDRVHALFARACLHAGEIGTIIWVHPDEEDILNWLEDGAKLQQEKQLRNHHPENE